ncbi:glycosyltransferase family 4 protein [Flavitalea antarctica]
MKILFISRATLFEDKGGDTIQVLGTKKFLEREGVQVDIKLCIDKIEYSDYDLIHFFNIIRPADILAHIKASGKDYVISTIYVDYSEYEKNHRKGLLGKIFNVLPPDFIEYLKVIARFLLKGEKIISPEYLWMGHRGSVKYVIDKASLLLPNSHSEYNRLQQHYAISKPYVKIPNGIDPELFDLENNKIERDDVVVICVGRIEGRKNQLNVIRALNGTKFKLYIIGSPAKNQPKYFQACKEQAASNVTFIENLPQDQLVSYYKRAKVHILASWFETTGLSTLEASYLGCNVVITDKGDTTEYFENYAFYCDPSSPLSIFAAVQQAASAPFDEQLRQKILIEYSWSETARQTIGAYKKIKREL